MKNNQAEASTRIQIQDLDHSQIQQLKKLDYEQLNGVVGGFVTPTGDVVDWPWGAGCPGGVLNGGC